MNLDHFLQIGGKVEVLSGHLRAALKELDVHHEHVRFIQDALDLGHGEKLLSTFEWFLFVQPGFFDLASCGRCRALLFRQHTLEECVVTDVMLS